MNSPRFALTDAPLVLRLLVVELVVARVAASGGGGDHSSGLGVGEPCCRVVAGSGTCDDRTMVSDWLLRRRQPQR